MKWIKHNKEMMAMRSLVSDLGDIIGKFQALGNLQRNSRAQARADTNREPNGTLPIIGSVNKERASSFAVEDRGNWGDEMVSGLAQRLSRLEEEMKTAHAQFPGSVTEKDASHFSGGEKAIQNVLFKMQSIEKEHGEMQENYERLQSLSEKYGEIKRFMRILSESQSGSPGSSARRNETNNVAEGGDLMDMTSYEAPSTLDGNQLALLRREIETLMEKVGTLTSLKDEEGRVAGRIADLRRSLERLRGRVRVSRLKDRSLLAGSLRDVAAVALRLHAELLRLRSVIRGHEASKKADARRRLGELVSVIESIVSVITSMRRNDLRGGRDSGGREKPDEYLARIELMEKELATQRERFISSAAKSLEKDNSDEERKVGISAFEQITRILQVLKVKLDQNSGRQRMMEHSLGKVGKVLEELTANIIKMRTHPAEGQRAESGTKVSSQTAADGEERATKLDLLRLRDEIGKIYAYIQEESGVTTNALNELEIRLQEGIVPRKRGVEDGGGGKEEENNLSLVLQGIKRLRQELEAFRSQNLRRPHVMSSSGDSNYNNNSGDGNENRQTDEVMRHLRELETSKRLELKLFSAIIDKTREMEERMRSRDDDITTEESIVRLANGQTSGIGIPASEEDENGMSPFPIHHENYNDSGLFMESGSSVDEQREKGTFSGPLDSGPFFPLPDTEREEDQEEEVEDDIVRPEQLEMNGRQQLTTSLNEPAEGNLRLIARVVAALKRQEKHLVGVNSKVESLRREMKTSVGVKVKGLSLLFSAYNDAISALMDGLRKLSSKMESGKKSEADRASERMVQNLAKIALEMRALFEKLQDQRSPSQELLQMNRKITEVQDVLAGRPSEEDPKRDAEVPASDRDVRRESGDKGDWRSQEDHLMGRGSQNELSQTLERAERMRKDIEELLSISVIFYECLFAVLALFSLHLSSFPSATVNSSIVLPATFSLTGELLWERFLQALFPQLIPRPADSHKMIKA